MMLRERQQQTAQLLLEIEAEMRRIELWAPASPSAEALASPLPFCCDTLSLAEWLQFIFIPRMKLMLEVGANLPDRCGIAPMAEECFGDLDIATEKLQALLLRLDHLLVAPADEPRPRMM